MTIARLRLILDLPQHEVLFICFFILPSLCNGTVLYQLLPGISKRKTEAKELAAPSLATPQQETQ